MRTDSKRRDVSSRVVFFKNKIAAIFRFRLLLRSIVVRSRARSPPYGTKARTHDYATAVTA